MDYHRITSRFRVNFTVCCIAVMSLSTNLICLAQQTQPPVAEKRPHEMTMHGHKRVDEYYWMRERENPKVIDWLNKENAYLDSVLKPYRPLQEKLENELRSRIKQDDETVPYPQRGYDCYARIKDGQQYPTFCRKKLPEGGITAQPEELILDQNELAKGHEYCSTENLQYGPDGQIVAWAVDFVGRRKYTIQFKDLKTGQMLPNEIKDTTGNFVFAEDGKHLFYTKQDPDTLRSYQVFRHQIGTDPKQDQLIYEEKDEEFTVFIDISKSREYVLVYSAQTLSSEIRLIDARNPLTEPVVFHPREADHEYSVDHCNGRFVIRTNWSAPNFRLMQADRPGVDKSQWQELLPHDADVFVDSFELLNDWLVVEERFNGLTRIRFRRWNESEFRNIDFGESCYSASMAATELADTNRLRYQFSSPKTPYSVFEYDLATESKVLLKQQEILAGFDSNDYISERLWATATDGTKIPVSVLRHKSTPVDGTAPLLIYGYGSYGASEDDDFNAGVLNLVNRGFVYSVAHIRGGQEMGRHWYENGKLLKKKNTFTDFIDCTKFLIEQKLADPKRVYAQGGSAGGLLMGAVMNMAPELYHGIIANVPFVDVVTTMLDDSIPLTTNEYDEWGNPNDETYYHYMLSYSPYDNVQNRSYPNLLVTTGLHDSQVQYWEPAKWVARLREKKTDQNLLLLHTEMSAGHGGSSGRYEQYRELAMRQMFLLMLAGIKE